MGVADRAVQRSLIHDRPQHGRVLPGQDLLSLDAGVYLLFVFFFGVVGPYPPQDGPGVVGCLEQAPMSASSQDRSDSASRSMLGHSRNHGGQTCRCS